MLSDRIAARGNTWPDTCLRNERASMYPEKRCYATTVALVVRGCANASGRFQLGVALDKFLCATARKTYRDAAVFLVAFDADDGSNAVARVADLATEHGIRVGTTFDGWPAERTGSAGWFGRCDRGFRFAAHTPQKLVR